MSSVYALSQTQADAVVRRLREALPGLMAVYAFGSREQGTAGPDSDLDLAVLVAGYADAIQLWTLSGQLADQVGCAVDLLDMRAASTVMQSQILATGRRLWGDALQAGVFESYVLSAKMELDAARAGLLADIAREGKVHGR